MTNTQPPKETIDDAELIKQMVSRFLGWKLPDDFSPDAGISFAKLKNPKIDMQPVGTNLFTATQAEAMIRYLTDGLIAQHTKSAVAAALDAELEFMEGKFKADEDEMLRIAKVKKFPANSYVHSEKFEERRAELKSKREET